MLEPEVLEREDAPDREQDRVAFGGGAVVEVDHVGPVLAASGPGRGGPDAEPDVDAVPAEKRRDDLGVPGVLGRHEPVARLDDGDRDAEAGVDLGELAARRTAAEDEQALRQLTGQGRLAIGPRPDGVEPGQRRNLRPRADGHDDVLAADLVGPVVVPDLDPSAPDDPRRAAEADGSHVLEPLDVRCVVRLLGARRPVDHVVAGRGRPAPRVRRRVRGVLRRTVEEGFRRQAADERTAPAEPQPIDDGDGRTTSACFVGGGLAGRAGTDDDEVERFHGSQCPRSGESLG